MQKTLIILSSLICVHGYQNGYQEYMLESDKVCPYRSNKLNRGRIELGYNDKSAAIIKETEYFSKLSGEYAFDCKFHVDSQKDMGLFMVIQKLNLRRNETTNECIDYVQVRHSTIFPLIGSFTVKYGNEPWERKICGEVDALNTDLRNYDPTIYNAVSPFAFIDPKGQIEFKIHIHNQTIENNTKLQLEVAFTAYYVCKRSYGGNRACGADACIWHKFFKDSIVNCPFVNCADEETCDVFYHDHSHPSANLATKVIVGAAAGVFTMFLAFAAFLWVFRHCSPCLRGGRPSHHIARSPEMRPVSTTEDTVRPTAPPLSSFSSSRADKDLPPSYDSLFPDA